MKAARLTTAEKQHVLVQTSNSTQFVAVRLALRTLFAEEPDRTADDRRHAKAWWYDDWEPYSYEEFAAYGDADWSEWDPNTWEQWGDESNYWYGDWSEWDEPYDASYDGGDDEPVPEAGAESPEEKQLNEAFTLASEANRTLQEARDAVKRVRMARGYYAPESNTGKGMSPSSSHVKGKFGKSKGKGSQGSKGKGFGPCFICAKPGHTAAYCPDRHSKGNKAGSKGKMSMWPSKGKTKGKAMYNEIFVNVSWDETASSTRSATRAVIDTGATENAVGADSLEHLVHEGKFNYTVHHENLPVFKFGNGLKAAALSCVVLHETALGDVSFFVLGGTGSSTPPLLGAKTLRQKKTLLSYANGLCLFGCDGVQQHGQSTQGEHAVNAIQMEALASGHLTIDLAQPPTKISTSFDLNSLWFLGDEQAVKFSNMSSFQCSLESHVYMVDASEPLPMDQRLQDLARRLKQLRTSKTENERQSLHPGGHRRSSPCGISMFRQALGGQDQIQSVRSVDQLQQVRNEDVVYQQGEGPRADSPDGSRPAHPEPGTAAVGIRDAARGCDGRQGEWKADGSERKVAAGGCPNATCAQHDVGGVPQAIGASWSCRRCSSVDMRPHERCDTDASRGDQAFAEAQDQADSGPDVGGVCQEPEAASAECNHTANQGEERTEDSCRGCQGDVWRGCGGDQFRGGDSRIWASLRSLRQRLGNLRRKSEGGYGAGIGSENPSSTTIGAACAHTANHDTTTQVNADLYDGPHLMDQHGNPGCRLDFEASRTKPRTRSTTSNVVTGSIAKKLSVQAAMMGAMVMAPVQSLMSQMSGVPDFMEIACAPYSALSQEVIDCGYTAKRINYSEGYDLESKFGTSKLKAELKAAPPRMAWVSLPCTRLSPLVNLTQRTEEEWANFEKRQQRDLRRADEVSEGICEAVEHGADFAWEWPTKAKKGWDGKCISRLLRCLKRLGRPAFWCRFHGCAYGLEFQGPLF